MAACGPRVSPSLWLHPSGFGWFLAPLRLFVGIVETSLVEEFARCPTPRAAEPSPSALEEAERAGDSSRSRSLAHCAPEPGRDAFHRVSRCQRTVERDPLGSKLIPPGEEFRPPAPTERADGSLRSVNTISFSLWAMACRSIQDGPRGSL